ncbi:MAG TPA: quinolinate synthase NadA [Phycisphaerales bacterium]|nr:quinolinate synthase NadA [Phycisphaerales bacterium]
MLWQPSLSDHYTRMPADEAAHEISQRRAQLGESLVILGHHYQTDEVIRHADFTGDSLKLSQLAAQVARTRPVRHVVFCGVHFMAETADMLTPEHVEVILPDLSAGCSMADMADYDDTLQAWDAVHGALAAQGWSGRVVPVTYVNSTAAIKAFVGQHGGACCTSSNADAVFDWAMRGGESPGSGDDVKILFLPDQHLGRNTAAKYGIDTAAHTCVYDPRLTKRGEPLGGATPEQVLASRVILWAGHCSVHKLFRPEHCAAIRKENAERARHGLEPTRILVHPECAKEVVDLADDSGSTEYIINTVRNSPPGSSWAIGTENHLVNRLADEGAARGVHVRILSDCQCLCTTMYRIDQPHLLWVLDNLCGVGTKDNAPKAVNVIRVHPEVRALALRALDRMLSLGSARPTLPVD